MFKYLSLILFVASLGLGGLYLWEKRQHEQDVQELNNSVSQLEVTVKEKENLYSKLAEETKKLKSDNKELQNLLKQRNEQVAGLIEANIKLKDQILQITNAHETPQPDGKIRVDFSKDNGLLKVSGYTLTGNPAFAEVKLEWIRNLKLQLVLAKDKKDNFRVYLDDKGSDIEEADLKLTVDPSVFDEKWYERVGFDSGILLGANLVYNVGAKYKVQNWLVGPNVGLVFDGKNIVKVYGLQVTWFPF